MRDKKVGNYLITYREMTPVSSLNKTEAVDRIMSILGIQNLYSAKEINAVKSIVEEMLAG